MNAGPLVAVLLAYLVCSPPAWAQRSAYIHGHVLDPSQAAVPEAAITVVNQESGFRRVTQTGSDGDYAVGSLESGTLQGHRPQRRIPHHDPLQREGGESGSGPGGFHAQRRRRAGDHHGGRYRAADRPGGRVHRGARLPRRHPAPSPEWPRSLGPARTLSRHQRHPGHARRSRPVHRQRAAAQRQLLHRGWRQRQYRSHRRRIARPGHRRRAARDERLRQPGLPAARGSRRRVSRADLQRHERARPPAGRQRRAHQPLRLQRIPRLRRLPLPARTPGRQRLVRQRLRRTRAVRCACTISRHPSAAPSTATAPSFFSPTST